MLLFKVTTRFLRSFYHFEKYCNFVSFYDILFWYKYVDIFGIILIFVFYLLD